MQLLLKIKHYFKIVLLIYHIYYTSSDNMESSQGCVKVVNISPCAHTLYYIGLPLLPFPPAHSSCYIARSQRCGSTNAPTFCLALTTCDP